jgi:hypothetical protein
MGFVLGSTKSRKRTDPVHVRWRLRLGYERGREDDEGKHHHKPDDMEPHSDLLISTWCPWMDRGTEPSLSDVAERRASGAAGSRSDAGAEQLS